VSNLNLNQVTSGTKNASSPVLTGLIYAFVMVMVSSVLFALLLYFTSLSDANLPLISYIVTAVSLLTGGFQAGRRSGSKGWYYGGLTGLIYGILLAIIGFLSLDTTFGLRNIALILLSFLFGAFGGIFGVNRRK